MSPVIEKIPAKYRAISVAKSGNLLATGRLMYANFFTAAPPSRNEKDPKKVQYGCTLLIPAGFDVSVLEAHMNDVYEKNVPTAKRTGHKWKNPLKKTAGEGTLASYAEDYPYMVRTNTKKFDKVGKERPAPTVVMPKNGANTEVSVADEPREVYNGRWAQLAFNPYWYTTDSDGISLGLSNVMLLWNDDPLAGGKVAANADFEAADDLDFGDDDMAGVE